MRILLVGPLPPPMNGCSYANAVLMQGALDLKVSCAAVDTSTPTVSGKQGSRFSIGKALRFVRVYRGLVKVAGSQVVYLTPGQTFFGLMKYAPFMVAALLLGKPYVIHVHGNYLGAEYAGLKGLRRLMFQWFVRRAAAGIVLSESLRANFDQLLPSGRVHVVENFAGRDIYQESLSRNKLTDKLRILYLSNLMREKGVLELLDALIFLKRSGVAFDLTIAGHMEPGIEADVAARLAELGAEAKYVGVVSGRAKSDWLSWANVSALPTYYPMEGQPIALLEGLAAGNIIVTTRHAGIPDVIDETNGVLVQVRDSDALADAFSRIAADVAGYVSKHSSHNAAYAASRFTEEIFTRRVLSVLEGVAAKGKGRSIPEAST